MPLREFLQTQHDGWKRRRQYRRHWKQWKAENPDGTHAAFYPVHAAWREEHAKAPVTLGLKVDPERQAARTARYIQELRHLGLRPEHLIVDFGCGSLWVGQGLMAEQDPGRYIGLDMIDHFYKQRLALLPPELIERAQPRFHVITPESLAAVRAEAPDYVLATAVLLHVVPQELPQFFGNLLALSVPSTRIFVQHPREKRSGRRASGMTWSHSDALLAKTLKALGRKHVYIHHKVPRMGHPWFEILPL